MENRECGPVAINCHKNGRLARQSIKGCDASASREADGVGRSTEAVVAPNNEIGTLSDLNGFEHLATILEVEAGLREGKKSKCRSKGKNGQGHENCQSDARKESEKLMDSCGCPNLATVAEVGAIFGGRMINKVHIREKRTDDMIVSHKTLGLLQQESAVDGVKEVPFEHSPTSNASEPQENLVDAVEQENCSKRDEALVENEMTDGSHFEHNGKVFDPARRSQSGSSNQAEVSLSSTRDEVEDNSVLRQLLKKPRYFNPIGEAMDCRVSARKQKKPCYACGDLKHVGKRCPKLRFCHICKERGHRAKHCSVKDDEFDAKPAICLKCGNSGHNLFNCSDSYSPDDLKKIRCYVCMEIGHLCCAKRVGMTAPEVFCYTCGMPGHAGENHILSRGDGSNSGPPRLCYKCGEEGHAARKCHKKLKRKRRLQQDLPTQTEVII